MSSPKTQRWKAAEYQFADVFQKFKIPATRVNRGADWGKSDTDVKIEGKPQYMLDSKQTTAAPFRHHGKYREIKNKYCKSPGDIPILFTKNYKEHFGLISVDINFFAALLSVFEGYVTKEEALEILNGK